MSHKQIVALQFFAGLQFALIESRELLASSFR